MDRDVKQAEPMRALRMTIAYRGDDLKVVSTQSVKMRVPPSDPTYGFEDRSGFWFEVRDDEQECVYRRVMPNPFVGELEAPSGDPERPFTRTKAPAREGVFVLLVPETETGRELLLCGPPNDAPIGRARPIAAIDLRRPDGKVQKIAGTEEPTEPKKPRSRSTKKSKNTKPRKGAK